MQDFAINAQIHIVSIVKMEANAPSVNLIIILKTENAPNALNTAWNAKNMIAKAIQTAFNSIAQNAKMDIISVPAMDINAFILAS